MGNRIVVSNSSPIILLHKIGQLNLLKNLYGKIYIPRAVYTEVCVEQNILASFKWINVIDIQNVGVKSFFKTNLHDGEIEVIILATEMSADLLILDDLLARKYAQHIGLEITGTIGVLLALKNMNIIEEVKPIMKQLLSIGMHIDKGLYDEVLASANE